MKDDDEETLKTLESSGKKDIATLTLIGYKGGALETQINQDRAFCVAHAHGARNLASVLASMFNALLLVT